MKSTLKALMLTLLGFSLSFCSSTPKEKTEETPEQYSSSGVYQDIANEGEDRKTSSEEYSDDDYGTVETANDSEGDDLFLSDTENYEEPEDTAEPAAMESGQSMAGNEPLPIDEPAEVEEQSYTAPAAKKVSSKFKNGMYKFKRKCNMRKKPSTKGRKAGKVMTGKKLWVEGHNSKWVKVYKKSGAVYVHRSCL